MQYHKIYCYDKNANREIVNNSGTHSAIKICKSKLDKNTRVSKSTNAILKALLIFIAGQ
jgi:hypothetical protein